MAQDATLTRPARARRDATLDEQKRSFLRMVSHELRTPLNSILGFSEILTSELYGPLGASQYKEYAGIIHDSGQKLLKLVNQVLEIARLEGRALEFDLASEPLDAALEDVLRGLAGEIAARGTRIQVAEEALPAVHADYRGLRTMLTQILANAVAYGPEGGMVDISARRDGGHVEIIVRDRGQGVDPREIPRLMAPFQQGDTALTRSSEGAGLGLPIADMTCRAMGGRLRLAPAEGGGLEAQIRLPAALP
jgi:signal transduction histidine kinase